MKTPNYYVAEIARLASLLNCKLVTAESCTGGMLSEMLTRAAGSSTWFECGYVAYSIAAKQTLLNVPAELIARHHPVSEAVVQAMAQGALVNTKANISLAITGITGPDGDGTDVPVGTICLAFAYQRQLSLHAQNEANVANSQTLQITGDRDTIRNNACLVALKGLTALLNQLKAESAD